jgi:hypothetical protein
LAYSIETSIYSQYSLEVSACYSTKKVYSDFQVLYQKLLKDFKCLAVPSLPSDIPNNASDSEDTKLFRIRLSLWLNYLLLHSRVVTNDNLITFVAGNSLDAFPVQGSVFSTQGFDEFEFDSRSQEHLSRQEIKKIRR